MFKRNNRGENSDDLDQDEDGNEWETSLNGTCPSTSCGGSFSRDMQGEDLNQESYNYLRMYPSSGTGKMFWVDTGSLWAILDRTSYQVDEMMSAMTSVGDTINVTIKYGKVTWTNDYNGFMPSTIGSAYKKSIDYSGINQKDSRGNLFIKW